MRKTNNTSSLGIVIATIVFEGIAISRYETLSKQIIQKPISTLERSI